MLLGAALVLASSVAASAEAADLQAGDDRSEQICQMTLGLAPGSGQHDFCVRSLSRSVEAVQRGGAVSEARSLCLARGLGGSALATCELDLAPTLPLRTADMVGGPPLPRPPSSFFHTTQREAFSREQHACAELGLEPVTDAFQTCVANLDASLSQTWNGGG